ncbi:MAG: hypothetical protein AB1Z98_08780 [Nannocystaceae bacterium]
MNSDPPRLLEDPSAAASLRQDLAHVDGATLEGLDLAAGLEQLRAATAATTATVPVATSGAGLSLAGKVGVGAALVVAAALWATRAEPDARQVEVTSAAPLATVSPERETTPTPVEEPQEPEISSVGAESAIESAALGSAKPEPVQPEPESAMAETTPAGSDPGVTSTAGPRRGSPPRRATAPSQPTPATEPAATPDETDDGVLREARMVARARASLAADPARAFELAEQAERDFPEGQLVEERRAIAIAALVALGRMDEARTRAQRFLARFSRGAHADAVRRVLGGHVDDD